MNLQSLHFHSPSPLNLPSNKNLLFQNRAFTGYFPPNPYCKFTSNSKSNLGLCNSQRRLSESTIIMRNHGASVAINSGESVAQDDAFYMRRCVEIASKAIGCTSPNPMVGCVIVKDGVVVGEGFHPKAGQPHAEVFALRNAGDLAENATAYVSLEPCNHYGRTPPCTEALIRAKVKRVVVGMVDPNPIVASKGVERLREAGIDVIAGVEEELCKRLNEAYIYRMLTGKPFLTLRYSLSVNGGLIDQFGEGAREHGGYYSKLLQEYDGVIYSSASISGNSFPTSQEPQAKQPLQIIIAKSPNSLVQLPNLTVEAASQFIIFTDSNTVTDSQLAQQGIETVMLEQLHLNSILEYCVQRGLCSVLLDLNGSLGDLKELVEESLHTGLLQKVVMEILPLWGENKETVTLGNSEKRLHMLKKLQSKKIGDTVVIDGYF